ncbi:MAG: hypothetical protein IH590_13245, partial [Aquamicrobium sp.]|nr:hypothetical protein [Aquamicrobium sp.]
AMAAAAETRPATPRMSATMISLPMPFILAKGTRALMASYMAEMPGDYQCRGRRMTERFINPARWILQKIAIILAIEGIR